MPARCKHPGNVTIYEQATSDIVFGFKVGVFVHEESTGGRPTGVYVAFCNDCGRRVRTPSRRALPAWAARLLDMAVGRE